MRIKGIKIDEDVARILNEQDKDETSIFENHVSGWASLYDYVSKAFDRLAAGYSHPSQVPDFLQTRDLLEKLTKHELKLAKQEFSEEDLQAALDRWLEEVDDYTNDFPEGSFAEWYGKDLSGQTYEGNLNCSNKNLTSLFGCPSSVTGYFDCSDNKLTSLEGAPKEVGGSFDCSLNELTSLEGAPKEVRGYFSCSGNQLTSLNDAPKEVGDFDCSNNRLTSLEGAPEKVSWGFSCHHNQLTSLEGAPKEVRGDFDCSNNKLISLEGAPEKVGGYFDCSDNPDFESFEGLGEVEGEIYSDLD